jgi:hypothetical protein
MFQILTIINCQAKIYFKINGEIKTFQSKHKLKQFNSKPVLQKIHKGILQTDEEERLSDFDLEGKDQ